MHSKSISNIDLPGVVRHLRRSVVGRLGLAITCALIAGGITAQSAVRANSLARDYQLVDQVWVTTADVAEGDTIGADDVSQTALPQLAVPDSVLTESPVGQRARRTMPNNSVLVAQDVADTATPLGAVLNSNERAVYLTRRFAPPGVTNGDRVELWTATTSGSMLLSTFARVIEVDEVGITVVVPLDIVEPLAISVAGDAVLVAVSGS
jgi:hypothetical protein